MRMKAGGATEMKATYPGQCVHEWTVAKDGGEICARGCGSMCRRDNQRKIESYSAGAALLKTAQPRRSSPRKAVSQ
jgi:hypothetical protein